MSDIKSFKDLDAWKKSHELRVWIIKLILQFPKDYQYGLSAQLQRFSISVSSNIAEGFGRTSIKEKLHFYSIKQGSLTEAQDQLLLCGDLKLINEKILDELMSLSEDVHKLIHGKMRYIRNTNSEIRDNNA
jgi:four helix bundle protein